MQHSDKFIKEISQIAEKIDSDQIESMVTTLVKIRKNKGRLFILGVGGSAANASHAVNDFRKLCAIETYAPSDNVSELTARTNDEGWHTVFSGWLQTSNFNSKDAIFVLSVGGGNTELNVSPNLISALDLAIARNASILGIIGRDGGYTKKVGKKNVIVIPTINTNHVTPHAEAFQAIIWHCLVSHPLLQKNATKW